VVHKLLGQEKVTAPQLQLVFLLKCHTVVSAGIQIPICCCSYPSGVDHIIDEVELLACFKDGPSVVDGLHVVDPHEIVVVTVLISEQLELRVKGARCLQRVVSQVAISELNSLVKRVEREVKGLQELVDFRVIATCRHSPLVADVNLG
jgi:hypothetical protein